MISETILNYLEVMTATNVNLSLADFFNVSFLFEQSTRV
jgi:hypothetical protein